MGPKKKRKTTPKKAACDARLAERRFRALELRKAGASFREIARTLRGQDGISKAYSESRAYEDVSYEIRALNEKNQQTADEIRRLEDLRLDRMLSSLDNAVEAGDPVAINTALRIMDRRAKLFGIDAPSKVAPTTPEGDKPFQGGVLIVPAPLSPEEWEIQVAKEQAALIAGGARD